MFPDFSKRLPKCLDDNGRSDLLFTLVHTPQPGLWFGFHIFARFNRAVVPE